jgi:hypothetical protein
MPAVVFRCNTIAPSGPPFNELVGKLAQGKYLFTSPTAAPQRSAYR